jgi:uncharacterized protein YbjQ (UPF0145 family)
MLLTTQDKFADYEITKTLGIVFGSTVRTKHVGTDFMAGLRGLFGGEISGYTELLVSAREEAYNRLIESAKKLNADGVVAIRFSTSSISNGASEILVTGTAVNVKK